MISPRLARILIYPVKSLPAVSIDESVVLPSGALEGDRRYALIDDDDRWIHAKNEPRIHRIAARFLDRSFALVEWSAPEMPTARFDLEADRVPAQEWLSSVLGKRVRLTADRQRGFPDDEVAPGPTLISTATLATVAQWFESWTVDEARRRFRANLEVDGVPPFWEDELFGALGVPVRFRVGSVAFSGINPCARCVVPSRSPETGEVWPKFAAEFARRREETLPPRVVRSRFDHFYRLAVNTRLAARPGVIRVGQEVQRVNSP